MSLGGLLISWLLLDQASGVIGPIAGFTILTQQLTDKFHMILQKAYLQYINLPALSVLIGGMSVMNFSFWGFHQYIIQRAPAAKDIDEAQKGIAFAALLAAIE